jgi:hypothetical protein
MAEIDSMYKKADGRILVEVRLSSVEQLFNSFDPAPFHEKELDADAEDYIVDMVDDFPIKTPIRLIIHLPETLATEENAKEITDAIRAHFRYRTMAQELKFRARFRHGRWALLVGLVFVAIAMIVRQLVTAYLGSGHLVTQIISDSLLIVGWAAMWEPVTVLLYELWPIRQQKNIYEKIAGTEIDILTSG